MAEACGLGPRAPVADGVGASRRRTLVRQLRLPDGGLIDPHGALPEIRWAVEIDHATRRGGRIDAQRDTGRDRELRRIGWRVARVTDVEIRDQFAATIGELVELVAVRRRELAA